MCGQYRLAEDLQHVLKHLKLENVGYVPAGTIQQMGDQGYSICCAAEQQHTGLKSHRTNSHSTHQTQVALSMMWVDMQLA